MLYPWQIEDAKRIFLPLLDARDVLFQQLKETNQPSQAASNYRRKTVLPHALLIYGAKGIGKQSLAQYLAQTLLCENNGRTLAEFDLKSAALACGQCKACRWFMRGNHPDFHKVVPENLQHLIEPLPANGANFNPSETKPRVLSKEIKIEQIRYLKEFCSISAHRGKLRIILIYPAQTLNVIAANALLKMLEEPPLHVCFILVSEHINNLLPTIVSRCQRVPLTLPPLQTAKNWLFEQKVDNEKIDFILARSGGAPLLALSYHAQANHLFENILLPQLEAGALCDVITCGELVSKTNLADFCHFLQCWVFDLMSVRLTQKGRYFPHKIALLSNLAQYVDQLALGRFFYEINKISRIANHPLNLRLTCETLLYAYCQLFNNSEPTIIQPINQ